MEEKVNLTETTGVEFGKLTKAMIRHDQKKTAKKAAKAAKKAAYEALSEEEKHALKKAKALKLGMSIGGGLAAAGAIVAGTIKVMSGKNEDQPQIPEEEETEDLETIDEDFPEE